MRIRPTSTYLYIPLVIVFLTIFAWAANRLKPESSPVARGAVYGEVRGCVNCHGDPNNPTVDTNEGSCSNSNKLPRHPEYNVNCFDVMAYFETVRLRRNFNERVQFNPNNLLTAGEHLARKYHCFNCHGHLGQGGFKNSKSLKGYIPGYFGSDFDYLTDNANPDSVRQWIMHGMNPIILDTPLTGRIAKFFFDRQAVSMPSFKSLKSQDIEILVNYVIALHGFGPMTAEDVRSYDKQSRLLSVSVISEDSR